MALPTTPATQTASAAIASATLNNYRDNLNFLLAPPIGRLTLTTQPSIATGGSFVAIAWDTEPIDTDGAHAASASSVIPTTAGYYMIRGAVVFPASNTTGTRRAGVFVNGTAQASSLQDPAPTAAQFAIVPFMFMGSFNGTTDFFDIRCFQSSGGALVLGNSLPHSSFVEWEWVHI